jgi:hypothetical protein
MALVLKDRVKETSTTTGTGTFTLAGASAGFQSFSVIGNANTTYYSIVDAMAGTWEVGIGTYTSSGTTLSRDTVLESSNLGSKVNFAAGTKDVFCTYPAEKAIYEEDSGNVLITSVQFNDGTTKTTNSAPSITVYTSGSGTYTTPTGAKYLIIDVVGGGGGGGGGGTPATATVGVAGGISTFGTSLLTANGGAGGASGTGVGGTATIGGGASGIAMTGNSGSGFVALTAQFGTGGIGGAGVFGGCGSGAANAAGSAAVANSGAGGGGGGGGNVVGTIYSQSGGGAGGYVKATISSPSSSYSYAVGAGGAGGAAGTNGFAGGAGGSGIINIAAYF